MRTSKFLEQVNFFILRHPDENQPLADSDRSFYFTKMKNLISSWTAVQASTMLGSIDVNWPGPPTDTHHFVNRFCSRTPILVVKSCCLSSPLQSHNLTCYCDKWNSLWDGADCHKRALHYRVLFEYNLKFPRNFTNSLNIRTRD